MKSLLAIAIPCGLLFGLLHQSQFSNNAALGIIWAMSILIIIGSPIALSDGEHGAEARSSMKGRPSWREHWGYATDAVIAVVLAGLSHWVTFSVFVVHAVLSAAIEAKAKEDK